MASLGVREVLRLLVHFRTWPYVIISRPGSPDYQAVLADLVALIAAARIGNLSALKFLIDKGVEVTWYDEVFSGPLHMAASGGHVSAMELLVHKGANINGQDPPRGRTPLHYAAEAGHVQATNFLIRMGAELNFLDVTRHSPINIAAALGHTNVVAELLTQKSVSPNKDILSEDSPLFLAIEGGHIDVVKVLLDRHDIDLDVERHLIGETPLVVAANYNRDSIVRLLLSRDDIRIEPRKGRMTPFCTAAQRGHLTIVQTLIEMQPDLDKNHRVEKGGLTPLIFAAHDGALDVLRLLLNCDDVDVNLHTTELPDSHGYTALEYAVKRGQIEAVKILLEHPRTQFYNPKGLGPTLLHSAVRSGKPRVVQLLLDHGAYVNSQDQRGQTPLHEGVSHRPQYSEEILKILLNYPKTMVNQRDHNGRTALTLAIRWGGDDRIKFLIDHPEIRICDLDNNGDSAFMHAVKKGHVGAVQRLLAKYPEGNDDHIKEGLKVASDAEIVQLLESRLDPGFMVD
ncbi:hypothetical protein FQN57_006595 [Myotisia sp. PD_48]|nr:hypothetical protein FQN57_006595 [Myotisia sp. PD_48]